MQEQTREVVHVPEGAPLPKGFGRLIVGPHYINRHMRRAAKSKRTHVEGEKRRKICARVAKRLRIERWRARK